MLTKWLIERKRDGAALEPAEIEALVHGYTADEVPDPTNINMKLWVNDELRQQANTRDLIVDIANMVSIASSASTLYPGDLIATGTPAGVGRVVAGDVVTIEVEHVGKMAIPVVQGDKGANVVFEKPYEFVRAS